MKSIGFRPRGSRAPLRRSSWSRRSSSVTYCGGASSISPEACAAKRFVGAEPLELVGLGAVGDRVAACDRPRRRTMSRTASARSPAWSSSRRARARRDRRRGRPLPSLRARPRAAPPRTRRRVVVGVVLGVDATAGEHPRAAVELQLRRAPAEQHLEPALAVAQQHDRRRGRGFGPARLVGAPRRSSIQFFDTSRPSWRTSAPALTSRGSRRRSSRARTGRPPGA